MKPSVHDCLISPLQTPFSYVSLEAQIYKGVDCLGIRRVHEETQCPLQGSSRKVLA